MAERPPTYYDVLQVAPDASPARIRAARRRLAQRYHPDRRADRADAGRAMAAVNAAYAVLSDPAQRAEHDRWIRQVHWPRRARVVAGIATEFRTFLRPSHGWPWYLLFGTIAAVLATVGATLFLGTTAPTRAAQAVAAPAVAAPAPPAR